jgi:hypothetical protein
MMAEVAKAAGSALAAQLRAEAARKQAELANQVKQQVLDNAPATADPGLVTFCHLNPRDGRGATGLGASAISGLNYGNGFSGGLGMDTMDFAAGAETLEGAAAVGAGAAATKPVDTIGGVANEAKEASDKLAAAGSPAKIGSPAAGGGGGGGGAGSASAPGLSRDPGAQEDKKEADMKITKDSAKYNGSAYSGGAWRPGSEKKDAAAANPFSALFNKDQARGPAATEVDAATSDLFTKISNRYGEVQKRKALLELE